MTFIPPDDDTDSRNLPPSARPSVRDRFEDRFAANLIKVGIWHSFQDCQKIIHELEIYQMELEAVEGELKVNEGGLHKWREETLAIAAEFMEVNDKLTHMTECPAKTQLRLQFVQATLRFLEGRFRTLFHGIAPEGR